MSESRNPTLQRLFAHLLLGERAGSGGPTIRSAWAQQHWQAPDLREDVEHSETHLLLRQVSLLPEESVTAVRALFGLQFDALDELGRVAIVTAHAENGITHARLATLTSRHSREVTLKLQELVRRGLLAPSEHPRRDGYRLPAGRSSMEVVGSSMEVVENSMEVAEKSTEVATPGVAGRRPARPYSNRAEQFEAVLACCATEWRTLEEIALSLGRAVNTVRNDYVRALIAQGRLDMLHPDNPRHPDATE